MGGIFSYQRVYLLCFSNVTDTQKFVDEYAKFAISLATKKYGAVVLAKGSPKQKMLAKNFPYVNSMGVLSFSKVSDIENLFKDPEYIKLVSKSDSLLKSAGWFVLYIKN